MPLYPTKPALNKGLANRRAVTAQMPHVERGANVPALDQERVVAARQLAQIDLHGTPAHGDRLTFGVDSQLDGSRRAKPSRELLPFDTGRTTRRLSDCRRRRTTTTIVSVEAVSTGLAIISILSRRSLLTVADVVHLRLVIWYLCSTGARSRRRRHRRRGGRSGCRRGSSRSGSGRRHLRIWRCRRSRCLRNRNFDTTIVAVVPRRLCDNCSNSSLILCQYCCTREHKKSRQCGGDCVRSLHGFSGGVNGRRSPAETATQASSGC